MVDYIPSKVWICSIPELSSWMWEFIKWAPTPELSCPIMFQNRPFLNRHTRQASKSIGGGDPARTFISTADLADSRSQSGSHNSTVLYAWCRSQIIDFNCRFYDKLLLYIWLLSGRVFCRNSPALSNKTEAVPIDKQCVSEWRKHIQK